MLDSEGLNNLNAKRQNVISNKLSGSDVKNLEDEVNLIHDTKEKRFLAINKETKQVNIRAQWLRFRAACWSHLHFNQFGVGTAERVEGERGSFVPKRFIEYILKLLYAHTDPATEEEKISREELLKGEYKDFLNHLRGIRHREGRKAKTYLRNPPGSSPKGCVIETDRQRGLKTYKGEMVMRKALNNDPHTSSLASGNLSNDNNLKRKAEAVVEDIVNLPLPQIYAQYGRSTAFQSPTDDPIYNTDWQNDFSGRSNTLRSGEISSRNHQNDDEEYRSMNQQQYSIPAHLLNKGVPVAPVRGLEQQYSIPQKQHSIKAVSVAPVMGFHAPLYFPPQHSGTAQYQFTSGTIPRGDNSTSASAFRQSMMPQRRFTSVE